MPVASRRGRDRFRGGILRAILSLPLVCRLAACVHATWMLIHRIRHRGPELSGCSPPRCAPSCLQTEEGAGLGAPYAPSAGSNPIDDVTAICACAVRAMVGEPSRSNFSLTCSTMGPAVEKAAGEAAVAMIAHADDAARTGFSRIAFAQAFVAGGVKLGAADPPPLSSPVAGLRAAIEATSASRSPRVRAFETPT
jgi:hypothetical protein